ncbi:hypothetical protein [Fibrella forsythiae]|uniref:ApeA N-terminal domain-containing protein n=1 Tax=Fibrella forsythiae TaxID=2817061 RepID=A0ABS3JNK8_9BACT|nr:hypothetical protein [Fibrella forsythiae]MBO0951573.1 hypothetical protein [Fibrella forsythiae]
MEFRYKHVFDFINQFETPKEGILKQKNSTLDQVQAKLMLNESEFAIRFSIDNIETRINKKPIHKNVFFSGIDQLKFTTFFINHSYFNISTNSPFIEHYNAQLSQIESKNFNSKKDFFYRLVIPVKEKVDIIFKIQDTVFKTELGRSRTGTCTIIDSVEYNVHCIEDKNTNRHFLVINSSKEQNINIFRKKSFSVLIGLGYLLGYYAGGRGYYIAYNNIQMDSIHQYLHSELRDTMQSSYHPVYANAYGWSRNRKHLKRKMEPVSIKDFSKLCQKIDGSLDFASVCLSIIEVSTSSLFPMACGYAVALESLSEIILSDWEQNGVSSAPITDKKVSKLLVRELIKTLHQICPPSSTPENSLTPLQKRIENVNQKTNFNALKAPFELYGINLTEQDIDVLKTRNDFLHGRIPLLAKDANDTIDNLNKGLFYAAIRLYTLVNIQILKYIGFSGWIVNYPKRFEKYHKIKLPLEKTFRKI